MFKRNWINLLLIMLVLLVQRLLKSKLGVRVQGYYRKDGTYVRSHYRAPPNSNLFHWFLVNLTKAITFR